MGKSGTVIDGRDRWRFTLTGSEQQLDLKTLDLNGAIRAALGPNVPYEIAAIAPWRRTEATADTFKVGRVILAGDAAHTMSPTGGFGMNTSAPVMRLTSAGNLTPCSAAGAGRTIQFILRSSDGRWPFAMPKYRAATITSGSRRTRITRTSWTRQTLGGRARARIGQFLMTTLQEEWESLGVQLGYRYEGSPIVVADGTPQTADDPHVYIQTARPGSRAPHAWLADGRSTIDLFGRGFVLLRFCAPDLDASAFEAEAAAHGVPFSVVDIDDPKIAALYERKLVLIRPDGHSAWRLTQECAARCLAHVINTVRVAPQDKRATRDSSDDKSQSEVTVG